MFQNKDLALQVREDLELISLLFERSLKYVVLPGERTEQEAAIYYGQAEAAVDSIYTQFLEKIYIAHPDLRRPKWTLPALERLQPEELSVFPQDPDLKPLIAERELALRLQEILLNVTTLLHYSARIASKSADTEPQLKEFKSAIGSLMLETFTVLNRMWNDHKDLEKAGKTNN